MDKLKTNAILVAIAVITSVVLVAAFGFGGTKTETVVREVVEKVGALAGPDIASPYLRWGDLATYRTKLALNTATNTPCAIQSPAATSTFVSTTLRINVGSSTATTWFASKGTSAYATTTNLGQFALGSGAQGTLYVATSTAQVAGVVMTVDSAAVFAPNTWIVWTVAGTAISDSSKFTGTCQAIFDSVE